MMETAITLLWLLCAVICPSPEAPYLPAEVMHCAQKGDRVCCELTHTLDRYCCPADDLRCEDDCSAAERVTALMDMQQLGMPMIHGMSSEEVKALLDAERQADQGWIN
jgi:hypothetical protein